MDQRNGAIETECCGAKLVTPYCPHCGERRAVINNIYGLLDHCRITAKSLDTQIKTIEAGGNRNDVLKVESNRVYLSKQESLQKWLDWKHQLDSLIYLQEKETNVRDGE